MATDACKGPEKTDYLARFGDAMERLCGGVRPPAEMLRPWIDVDCEPLEAVRLQEFAALHGPKMRRGIDIIEEAMSLADITLSERPTGALVIFTTQDPDDWCPFWYD